MNTSYNALKRLMHAIYNARLTGPAILDEAVFFPGASRFRENWQVIRDEALRVAHDIHKVPRFHEIMPEQKSVSANDQRDWRMYILRAYRVDVPQNMRNCPRLAELLKGDPSIISAALSFMGPRKIVPEHTGPFRGITRYYLALSIPLDEARQPLAHLVVDGMTMKLHDGEDLLWDDTYSHSATNHSDEIRAVLLLDVFRKQMPWDLRMLTKALIRLTGFMVRARRVFAI